MAGWAEDHVEAIGFLNLNFGIVGWSLVNWTLDGDLMGKRRTGDWEGRGV
jgi:hypothetical protein